jgi:hypothetical protein
MSGALAAVVLGPGALQHQVIHQLSTNAWRVLGAAFLELVMAVTVGGIAFLFFPMVWHDARTPARQGLAVWYLGSRITEGAAFLVGILGLLSLLGLSRAAADSAAPPASYLPIAAALETIYQYSFILGQTVFCIGAAMLYYLLLVARRAPRWLAVWGLAAAPMMLVGGLLLPFTGDPNSTASTLLYAPMALQEMVLALWLIARGFTASQHEAAR